MQLYDLKTLHMDHAFGIDQVPYFSWKIKSDKKNVIQEAYQIKVFSGETTLWDTGKLKSRQQSFVEYAGLPLQSKTIYKWQATVWDNHGEMSQESGCFETAFLEQSDWKAKWIESSIPRVPVTEYKYGNTAPAVFFEKKFCLRKKVRSARLYATCYGTYRLRVNEKRPDDREFAPEFTAYGSILYYQTYDVGSMLKLGENTLDMYVGDGWYFSLQAGPVVDNPHEKPSVLFQLEISYEDGSREIICSDGEESCSLGPICYSDIFQGEKQDWRIGFEEKQPVLVKDYGYSILQAQPMPPVRPIRQLPAVEVMTSPAGEMIVDFGQILAGRARVHIDVPAGREVTLEYFEILDEFGNYNNTMFVPQKDIVISNGNPVEHEVYFTFHGFRYIRVTGLDEVKKEDFTAVLLTTEKENLASFSSSDHRMNRLYKNVRWSQANNMMSIPTDCPSREKAGWTGDLLVYARTALINEDVTPFLTSWLANVRANQAENGCVMLTTPYTKLYHNLMLNTVKKFGDTEATGIAGWSDAIVWVPYEMYRVTGNKLILKQNFKAMKKWCDYIIKTAKEKRGYHNIPEVFDQYLWNTGFHFGEWLIPSRPDNTGEQFGICKESAFYIAPFFGFQTLVYMAEICQVLGKEEEQKAYSSMAEKMKYAIQQGIFYPDMLPKHLMGAYILAFAFDLVPEDLYEKYKKRLMDLITLHEGCLDTGFLATPFILDTLYKLGESQMAYQILWQNKQPSWLYQVEHGATAIWESWDADEAERTNRVVSFDHYAFGCVDDWISRHLAGIDSDVAGYSHVLIHPDMEDHLTSCSRTFKSEAGEISVSWTKDELNLTIPCNTTATVEWKGKVLEVGSGSYRMEDSNE